MSHKSRFKAAFCNLLTKPLSYMFFELFQSFLWSKLYTLVFIYFDTFEIQLSHQSRPILFSFSRHSKIFTCLTSYINEFGNSKSDKQKALKKCKLLSLTLKLRNIWISKLKLFQIKGKNAEFAQKTIILKCTAYGMQWYIPTLYLQLYHSSQLRIANCESMFQCLFQWLLAALKCT